MYDHPRLKSSESSMDTLFVDKDSLHAQIERERGSKRVNFFLVDEGLRIQIPL